MNKESRKLDFFYKRTCFRLFTEYFKFLFTAYNKKWISLKKEPSALHDLTKTFAYDYFSLTINNLP